MNTSTQPSEGAGGSRSRAAGELTLGLMSGEERGCTPIGCCSSVGASLLAMDDNDNAGSLIHLGALRFFASRLACMFRLEGAGGSRSRAAGELTLGLMSGEERGCTPICCCSSVGASLLAMDDNDNAGSLIHLGALRFFASRLACMFRLEGVGGSRSSAAGELTLGLMSGEERGCTPICCCSSVGASLLAMDDNDNAGRLIHLGALRFFASRLACMFRLEGVGGSRSRAAGELTLGLMSGEEPRVYAAFAFVFLWEPACWRWRPDSRPISCRYMQIKL
jgi:hypothetical protein